MRVWREGKVLDFIEGVYKILHLTLCFLVRQWIIFPYASPCLLSPLTFNKVLACLSKQLDTKWGPRASKLKGTDKSYHLLDGIVSIKSRGMSKFKKETGWGDGSIDEESAIEAQGPKSKLQNPCHKTKGKGEGMVVCTCDGRDVGIPEAPSPASLVQSSSRSHWETRSQKITNRAASQEGHLALISAFHTRDMHTHAPLYIHAYTQESVFSIDKARNWMTLKSCW